MNSINFIKNYLLSLLLVFNLSFAKQTGAPNVEIAVPVTNVKFQSTNKPPYKKYFNGRNFSKWVLPEGNIWWKIEDKVIKAKSGLNKKGTILWTEKEFKNYKVRLKFKFIGGTIDSGIFMRGDNHLNPQIQIGISGSLKRDMTGSPYVPKKGYPKEATATASVLKMNGWNTIEAQAIDNNYKVWINGKYVMDYDLENANLNGPLGIQLHPNREMEIWFKDISIAKIK
ncbi:MAG: 3-keto-disaccharide hydrolase [Flavobacteriales bacterium]